MPYLIRTMCPNCGRTYRYSSDSQDAEAQCPFAECWFEEDMWDEASEADEDSK